MEKVSLLKKEPLHLRGLNGIRAIASIAVLISHISLSFGEFGLLPLFGSSEKGTPVYMASYGVTMFFALSGFLITYLLLKEKEKQTINVRHFYVRRILRIWPLYYLYVAICLISYLVFKVSFNGSSVPFYIFFAANIAMIVKMMLPYMGHLWSIGVEEQFYIFWPWVSKIENKKLIKFSIVFVIIFYLLKVLFYLFKSKYVFMETGLIALGVSRFHIMIIGGIGGILYYNNSKLISFFTKKSTQLFCWLILVASAANIFHISSALVDHEIIAIITVLIIFGQISRKNIIFDLDKKWINFVGKISFGIYVIHPFIIFLLLKIIGTFQSSAILNYVILFCLIFSLTISLAWISYNFYEKPFIKMKDRFTKIRSRA